MIREACAAEGGVEVDTQGDAFFFAFSTAPGALSAANAMTEALASGPIQVRVGAHTGTPLVTSEGYVGDDVHFAARVAASSHGGQILLSKATAELVELELTDLGEHRLKDITEAVQIFQLGNGSFPPLKTISNTNLPRPASSFVGREAEVEAVLSRIEAGARLVTLTGPGGSGKTRLAIEAAATLVSEYKAGVFWVGLAALRDPALVTETIAQTLGASDGLSGWRSARSRLCGASGRCWSARRGCRTGSARAAGAASQARPSSPAGGSRTASTGTRRVSICIGAPGTSGGSRSS